MTEKEKPKQFERWAESLDKLEDLEQIVEESEKDDREWKEKPANEKLLETAYRYATLSGIDVTREQINANENERNNYINGYRESLKYTSGNQVSGENIRGFINGLVNHNSGKTLDTLVALELENPDKPILRTTMNEDEMEIYMAYAKAASQKSLLKRVEEKGLATLPKEIREKVVQSASEAYADERQKELEKAYEKNPMGKRFYKHLYAASLIAAWRDSELLKKYATDGIKKDIEKAEKEYKDFAKLKKLDIHKVVAANVERLANGSSQTYRAMKERLYTAYKLGKE